MLDRDRTEREEIEDLASRMPTEGSQPPGTATIHGGGSRMSSRPDVDQMAGGQASNVADRAKSQVDAQRGEIADSLSSISANDIERLIRDHPAESVAAAFAVGFLIGVTLKS